MLCNNFFSTTLPNWIMAIAAAWGVFEIIRGYFSLKKQQKENNQKLDYYSDQLNELRKQTTQFEYQTNLMNDNNRILEQGIENLIGILGQDQEAHEQLVEIERQRRLVEIRPYFTFRRASSNPREFSVTLGNRGGTASNLSIIEVSSNSVIMNNIPAHTLIEQGQDLVLSGRSNGEINMNFSSFQILLAFEDVDGNSYRQNIIKNNNGYQVNIPRSVEEE